MENSTLTIGLAQIAPVWFDREKTLAKICDSLTEAVAARCKLVAFGEALVPGYPFWLEYSRVSRRISALSSAASVMLGSTAARG